MKKINVSTNLDQGMTATASISVDDVHVSITTPHGGDIIRFTWDQLPDLEHLAEVYQDMQVRHFRPLVAFIGMVYCSREQYTALLK